jgi:hypothetical protein
MPGISPLASASAVAFSLALATAFCSWGCGGGDRPPPVADSQHGHEWSVEAFELSQNERGRVCEPGSSRECRLYYTDHTGQAQCPMSFALCREDGSDWLPCGEYFMDEDGRPVDRDGNAPR